MSQWSLPPEDGRDLMSVSGRWRERMLWCHTRCIRAWKQLIASLHQLPCPPLQCILLLCRTDNFKLGHQHWDCHASSFPRHILFFDPKILVWVGLFDMLRKSQVFDCYFTEFFDILLVLKMQKKNIYYFLKKCIIIMLCQHCPSKKTLFWQLNFGMSC